MSAYPWAVVLDANVHLRSSARDLFLYLGTMGVIDPIWSELIMEEVARNFPTGRAHFDRLRLAMDRTYPGALKRDFEHRIAQLTLTSEKDRHILALAGEYEADLVTFNCADFDRTEARHLGVGVWHPDDALERLLLERRAEAEQAARRAYLMLRKPPVRWTDFIDHIRADEMPKTAGLLGGMSQPFRPIR